MRLIRSLFLRFVLVCAINLLALGAVPTPDSHFGHAIGVDRELLDWDQVVSYFYKLEKSSAAIRVEEVGKSVEGRPFIAAIMSSPDNIKHLPKYLEIQRRLADPRITTSAEAEKLFPEARAVVLISCSIHASEVASTHSGEVCLQTSD